MSTATVSITKPQTENDAWYVAHRATYSLSIEQTDGRYHGGQRIGGFHRTLNGCSSNDLDDCIARLRAYMESDHE